LFYFVTRGDPLGFYRNMTTDNYSKLDEFIRKYYKNRLIRGGIFFIALLTVFFLVIILSEYFGRFNTVTRTVIFYSYIGLNVLILLRLILIPAFKLLKLGKIISHEEAAGIIGIHFPEISDKLLNTLQLKILQDLYRLSWPSI
jgi:cytochrome c biogenesis protein CcdA